MKKMIKVSDTEYISEDGCHSIKREYGDTPNGNRINGRWVLRGSDGMWIDFDKYRSDLMERNNFREVY